MTYLKESDKINDEIEIDNFNLETARGFLDSNGKDPLLYNGYKLIETILKGIFTDL